MKVLMVGGGTGGHVYPAISIAQAIQDVDINSQILFVGSEGGIETKIVPNERFSLVTIRAKKMLRKLSLSSIMSPAFAVLAIFDSIKVIKSFKPDVIVATGGFVSLPVAIAAVFTRVPVLLYEANVIPGLATRICKWFATRITISFEASRKYFRFRKVYCIGSPVRKEIIKAVKGISIQHMNLRQDKKIILIVGGSQGAKSMNQVVIDSLDEFAKMDVQVVHISGERDYDWVRSMTAVRYPFYFLLPYMHNIWDGLAAADVVVSRAGATAISEILVRAVPSILIPFPFSSERHQDLNASVLGNAGASIILKDNVMNKDTLTAEIKKILNDKELYTRMQASCRMIAHPNAAIEAVNIIFNLLKIDPTAKKKKKPASIAGKKKKNAV
jgi:UDP-N-acetylglucosamine--N-acetylmuramyl-(pentapeptide) pyrophosphoryl-undecaprenol N-acetylglucosamine transferase